MYKNSWHRSDPILPPQPLALACFCNPSQNEPVSQAAVDSEGKRIESCWSEAQDEKPRILVQLAPLLILKISFAWNYRSSFNLISADFSSINVTKIPDTVHPNPDHVTAHISVPTICVQFLFSLHIMYIKPACPYRYRCAMWRSGFGQRSTSSRARVQRLQALSRWRHRQSFGGWICQNNLWNINTYESQSSR